MTTSISGLPVPDWDIADRLRKTLRESDIGVQEMADHIGVSRNTVSAWINGRGPVDPEKLPAWADLTGFPIEWIENGETGNPTPPKPPGITPFRRHPKARVVRLRANGSQANSISLAGVDEDALQYVALTGDPVTTADQTTAKPDGWAVVKQLRTSGFPPPARRLVAA